jgi:hypothetical protein
MSLQNFEDIVNAAKEQELEIEELKRQLAEKKRTRVEVSTDITKRPHPGSKVKHEKGIVTGIRQLDDGRFQYRGEDVVIDGVRTHKGSKIFDNLGDALIYKNKVLEALYLLGVIDVDRLLKRQR